MPQYLWSDAWISHAIAIASRDAPASLADVIGAADSMQHTLPNLDELHGAFARLTTAGFIEEHNERFALTACVAPEVRTVTDRDTGPNAAAWFLHAEPRAAERNVTDPRNKVLYPGLTPRRLEDAELEYHRASAMKLGTTSTGVGYDTQASVPAALPRWVQVPAGLVLAAAASLCIIGTIAAARLPSPASPVLVYSVTAALLGGSLWVLAKAVRLIAGRSVRGNLIGPTGLEVFAWTFLLMPVASFFLGGFPDPAHAGTLEGHPVITAVRLAVVLGVFFGVRRLAASRRRR